MSSAEGLPCASSQTHLVRHFAEQPVELHTDRWSQLWDTDNSDLWDRGKPSPALVDLIEERRDLVSLVGPDGRKKKALVPGCGKGYDVVMLALHGYDVYGLEISSTGVSVARRYAENELANPQAYNWGASRVDCQPGQVEFIQGDFFKRDWEKPGLKFDLIYDYTFLCALHPTMRPQWAARMAELLIPGGQLVCLEFPLYKDPSLPGPPWGLKGVHWNLLAEGGDGIVHPEQNDKEPRPPNAKFTRTLYVKPARSYESGRGTDMLSLYTRTDTQ
ncbi:thiol methyltransferase [Aspergillus saccharolyticus JOP 1030-1]|uniref:Thiol methyltransferase n=1 Tax=Aspergillus saccharolyticus JOP 1030-1 TaxID=1450539 RepID=A0A318ZNF1_9EURO|nr:thiol methyltransferase [Aspergillus saccharolyticus JOP 1030-1]PYH45963.1 thiol methyltransferase [Aspergillus saccharolyticus JOP 1030-1]